MMDPVGHYRGRPMKLLRWLILLAIAIALPIIIVNHVHKLGDDASEDAARFFVQILGIVFVVVLIIVIIRAGVKGGIESAKRPIEYSQQRSSAQVIPEYKPPIDGPGMYRVEGVDRATKMDTTLHVHASSAANAKAKAELDGVIVTDVKMA